MDLSAVRPSFSRREGLPKSNRCCDPEMHRDHKTVAVVPFRPKTRRRDDTEYLRHVPESQVLRRLLHATDQSAWYGSPTSLAFSFPNVGPSTILPCLGTHWRRSVQQSTITSNVPSWQRESTDGDCRQIQANSKNFGSQELLSRAILVKKSGTPFEYR